MTIEQRQDVIKYYYQGLTKEEIQNSFNISDIEFRLEVSQILYHLEKIDGGIKADIINEKQLYEDALCSQAQALFSDILKIEFEKSGYKVISETIDKKNSLRFYLKFPEKIYYEEALTLQEISRALLEKAMENIFNEKKEYAAGQKMLKLVENYTKSLKSIRTNSFINNVIEIYGRMEGVINSFIDWNSTPECLPCLDGVIDFSGENIIRREPEEKEYFKNPFQFTVDDIKNGNDDLKLFSGGIKIPIHFKEAIFKYHNIKYCVRKIKCEDGFYRAKRIYVGLKLKESK